MRRHLQHFLLPALAVLLAVPVLAQTTGLSIPWLSVDGGGGASSGGDLTLAGTIGQYDAGVMTGGDLTLTGGFWGAANAVGVSALSPASGTSTVGVTTTFSLRWTHPERWRDLTSLDLRLRDEQGIVLWARFTEGVTGTFSLLDEDGKVVQSGVPGERRVLETPGARLDLAASSFIGSGPAGPDVTVHFAVAFEPIAAGRTYAVELLAREDSGNTQGPDRVGTWTVVPPSRSYLPLVMNRSR
jgi:hypothetical protein